MSDGKIKITIDPDLKDLIPQYLENRNKDVTALKKAVMDVDYELTRNIGHKMKGSGGGYGFEEISNIGRDIENASKEKQLESIQKSIKTLEHYLSNLEIC